MKLLIIKSLILFFFTLLGWGLGIMWFFANIGFKPEYAITLQTTTGPDLKVEDPASLSFIYGLTKGLLLTDFGQDSHALLIGATSGLVAGCVVLMMVELKRAAGRIM